MTWELYRALAREDGSKASGDPPLVLHNASVLARYLPTYRYWRAAGKPLTLTEILTLPVEMIDALFTLSWLDSVINRDSNG